MLPNTDPWQSINVSFKLGLMEKKQLKSNCIIEEICIFSPQSQARQEGVLKPCF